MPSPVMDFGSMPTEAHVLRVLVASALGPQSLRLWGMCVAGHGALDAPEHTPRKLVPRRGHFPLSLDDSGRAVVFPCYLQRNL